MELSQESSKKWISPRDLCQASEEEEELENDVDFEQEDSEIENLNENEELKSLAISECKMFDRVQNESSAAEATKNVLATELFENLNMKRGQLYKNFDT